MRYTRRTTGISIYWMHELYRGLYAELDHKSGDYLCPDTFTKPLNDEKFSRFRLMLGVVNVDDKEDMAEFLTHYAYSGGNAPSGSSAGATA